MYAVYFSKAAQKDKALLQQARLEQKTKELLDLLVKDPYQNPPPYEKLCGDLAGCYLRRINRQHRLVYAVDETAKSVRVLRMWTHYE